MSLGMIYGTLANTKKITGEVTLEKRKEISWRLIHKAYLNF
jgi:hypothetical protein